MANKLLWGLIGNEKIREYSIAPKIWKELFRKKNVNVRYFILGGDNSSRITINIKKYLNKNSFIGCSIALPWKYLGYEFCDYVENSANRMEAINTLIKKNNCIEGYNTDGIGMIRSIEKLTNLSNKSVLILGSGSSAQTIPFHLINRGVKKIYTIDILEDRSKKLARKYSDVAREKKIEIKSTTKKELPFVLEEADILINTTPCGMKGFEQKYPFEKRLIRKIKKNCIVAEAVYTPYLTPLLKEAKKQGNKVSPGVIMLVEQAAESYFLAFGERLSEEDKKMMENTAREELSRK